MTYPIHMTRLILPVLLLTLPGCFSLERETPPDRFYVLGGSRQQEAGVQPERLAGLTVGLRRLELAGYLETPLIVVRQEPHEIHFAEFHRWGADLEGGVNRAVAGYLATLAAFEGVDVAPWLPRMQHDYVIQLHLLRFEGVTPEEPTATEGEAYLLANWEIIRPEDGALLARGTTDYRAGGWTIGDYGGLVTLLDGGLRELADDLIAGLEPLVAP